MDNLSDAIRAGLRAQRMRPRYPGPINYTSDLCLRIAQNRLRWSPPCGLEEWASQLRAVERDVPGSLGFLP